MNATPTAETTKTRLPEEELAVVEIEGEDDGWLSGRRFAFTIAVLLILFATFVFWRSMVITVHSGEQGVRWGRFAGTDFHTIYREGTHLIFPWDTMTVYDMRVGKVDNTVEVLSTDGLAIFVDITIQYVPIRKTLPYLHSTVGPDYVNRITVPAAVAAVRVVMGKYRPQELYTISSQEMQAQIVAIAAERTRENYVEIEDVLVRRIKLPPLLEAGIQKKLTQEQESEEYDFRLKKEEKERQRKNIEGRGIKEWQELVKGGATNDFLRLRGIEATLELSKSPNTKTVVIGGKDGMPLILNQ